MRSGRTSGDTKLEGKENNKGVRASSSSSSLESSSSSSLLRNKPECRLLPVVRAVSGYSARPSLRSLKPDSLRSQSFTPSCVQSFVTSVHGSVDTDLAVAALPSAPLLFLRPFLLLLLFLRLLLPHAARNRLPSTAHRTHLVGSFNSSKRGGLGSCRARSLINWFPLSPE